MPLVPCIYCSREFDSSIGAGDHVIPTFFGEFANLRRFRGMCHGCNERIGHSEQQLAQCGPESYLARIGKPPERWPRTRKRWTGAMGAPAPSMLSEHNGARLLSRPIADDPRNIELVDQLVVEDQRGRQYPIPIFAGMTADVIRAKIKGLGTEGTIKVHFSVSEETSEWFEAVKAELWPGAEGHDFPTMEVGVYPGWGTIVFETNDHYFRALAKMAFHYYLAHTESGVRGDETEFASLRRFVMDGGDPGPFLHTPRTSPVFFGIPFGEVAGGGMVSSGDWSHLLAFDDTGATIVVFIQLFIGPGYVQPPYYVVIGPAHSCRTVRSAQSHLLRWERASPTKGTVKRLAVMANESPEIFTGPGLDWSDIANPVYTLHRHG